MRLQRVRHEWATEQQCVNCHWQPNLCLSYLLLYNTLPPNSSTKQYLLFHSSCGSEIRRGLAQGFWLKISQEVAVKLSARAADSSEAPTEVEDQLPSSCPCCWPSLVPHHEGFTTVLPWDMIRGFRRVSNARKHEAQDRHQSFYNLILKAGSHYLCHILLVRSKSFAPPILKGRDETRMWK